MEIEQFKMEIKIAIIRDFKNINEAEIDKGLSANDNYIKYCFEHDFSIQHVVHELTI